MDDIQFPCYRTIRMTLIDTDIIHDSQQNVTVVVTPLGVSIIADGYGTANSTNMPVFVTQQKGELVVIINGDINVAGATHVIRLGKAKEANRRRGVMDTR